MTMHSPVMVQMTMVSINVPVMETSPCRTGSLVLAAAAAMGRSLSRPRWRKYLWRSPSAWRWRCCHNSAGHRLGIESAFHDGSQSTGDLLKIEAQKQHAERDVNNSHKRHHHLGYLGDPAQAADDYQSHADGNDHAGDNHGVGIIYAKNGDGMAGIGIKEIFYRGGNSVNLGKGADTEQAHAHAEEGEHLGEPLPIFFPYPFQYNRKARPAHGRPRRYGGI